MLRKYKKTIDEFFATHLLFWIEALNLMENLDIGVHALSDIWRWYALVSGLLGIPLENTYSCLLRWELPASG